MIEFMKLLSYGEIKITIRTTETAIEQLIKLNSLLAKFNRSQLYRKTLNLFNQIHSSINLKPDQYSLSSTITACVNLRDIFVGNQLHCYSIQTGLKSFSHVGNSLLSLYAKSEDLTSVEQVFAEIDAPDVYSWTTLLSCYAKSGWIDHALEVFDKITNRNVAVWNAIITGYAEIGDSEIVFDLFRKMHCSGVNHDNYTFASVLSICKFGEINFGKQVHSLITKTGFFTRTSVVNSQITMYFNCGDLIDAYNVLDEAESSFAADQITYNAMIAGLAGMEREEEAMKMFMKMHDACLRPTELTFISVLSLCSSSRIGRQIHDQAIKTGFESCTSVSNAAVAMYSNCGELHEGEMIFNQLKNKDIVSWNTIIASYAQGYLSNFTIQAYLEMQRKGFQPDEFTIGSLLTSVEFLHTVEMIHSLVSKNGLILKIQVSNALISSYSKLGNIHEAGKLFRGTSFLNLISWNTIISGLLLNGFPLWGLYQFSKMILSGIRPNTYSLSIALSICASISALKHGKELHTYILRVGFHSKTALENALITLYAKCGVLDCSIGVFNEMTEKDTVSWNSLISAYAQHGKGKDAVKRFEEMQNYDITPDNATFTAVLSACSHAGLVTDGLRIFNSMVKKYGFTPEIDHFSCIVDLLGRAGFLDEAEGLVNCEYLRTHPYVLWTLMSACAAHGNLRLGKIVAGFLLQIEENNPSVNVMLSNIVAASSQWEAAESVRAMQGHGLVKQPACSWIRS